MELFRGILWLLTLIVREDAYSKPLLVVVLFTPCTSIPCRERMGAATQLILCLPNQVLDMGLHLLGTRDIFFLLSPWL